MPKRRQLRWKRSGSARMKEQGYHRVEVWLSETELNLIGPAALADRKPLSTFIRFAAWVTAGGKAEDFILGMTLPK